MQQLNPSNSKRMFNLIFLRMAKIKKHTIKRNHIQNKQKGQKYLKIFKNK